MDFAFVLNTFSQLLAALPITLGVWFLSVTLGLMIAMGVTWMRVSGFAPLAWFARAYVFIFRGSPLLIQLFMIYYGLSSFPAIRHSIFWPALRDPFFCGVLSLALCTAAYESEIFRGALAAVPNGQVEAAKACGMNAFLRFRRIIFPIALRQALPALSTDVITMTKATALVSLVTLWDVMSVALKIRNDTLITYTPLLVAGFIYLVLNFLISRAFQAAEYALSGHLRPRAQ
jgi:octopine/nopaline transport system permease protein